MSRKQLLRDILEEVRAIRQELHALREPATKRAKTNNVFDLIKTPKDGEAKRRPKKVKKVAKFLLCTEPELNDIPYFKDTWLYEGSWSFARFKDSQMRNEFFDMLKDHNPTQKRLIARAKQYVDEWYANRK